MQIAGVKSHLIIVDLEATCWERSEKKYLQMETIEIGAVKIDLSELKIMDEYDAFVKPVRNPILSDFCTELTSIRQENVDAADEFPDAFLKFLDWIGDRNKSTFGSWSKYDRWQFQQDCNFHKIEYPFDHHFDIKKYFAMAHNNRRYGLKRAIRKSGLEFRGTHHRGIDDAKNIWYVLEKLIRENEQLSLF